MGILKKKNKDIIPDSGDNSPKNPINTGNASSGNNGETIYGPDSTDKSSGKNVIISTSKDK